MDKRLMIENMINHYTDGNQAKFAALLGIHPQNISAWLKRGSFNAELIYSKLCDVSADWLLSGEGNMLTDKHYEASANTTGDFSPAVSGVQGDATVTISNEGEALQKERIAHLQEKVQHLQEIIEEKERLITVLMETRR